MLEGHEMYDSCCMIMSHQCLLLITGIDLIELQLSKWYNSHDQVDITKETNVQCIDQRGEPAPHLPVKCSLYNHTKECQI